MMICPQTKAECKAKYCQRRNVCWDEKFPTPPKPTMDECERLLDEYANSIFYPEMASEKRAALIDWVRNNLRIS